MRHECVELEIKQIKNFPDNSLKAHLEAKGMICDCCGQLKSLCRCITQTNNVRKNFAPRAS